MLNGYLFHTLSWCDKCARVFTAAGEDRWNKQKAGTLLLVTFIKVGIILCVLGEREAVGDLKSVVDYQAQQDALNHLAALALFLVVLDNLQHHLWKSKKKSNISAAVEKEAEREVDDSLSCFQWQLLKTDFIFWIDNILSILSFIAFM